MNRTHFTSNLTWKAIESVNKSFDDYHNRRFVNETEESPSMFFHQIVKYVMALNIERSKPEKERKKRKEMKMVCDQLLICYTCTAMAIIKFCILKWLSREKENAYAFIS